MGCHQTNPHPRRTERGPADLSRPKRTPSQMGPWRWRLDPGGNFIGATLPCLPNFLHQTKSAHCILPLQHARASLPYASALSRCPSLRSLFPSCYPSLCCKQTSISIQQPALRCTMAMDCLPWQCDAHRTLTCGY